MPRRQVIQTTVLSSVYESRHQMQPKVCLAGTTRLTCFPTHTDTDAGAQQDSANVKRNLMDPAEKTRTLFDGTASLPECIATQAVVPSARKTNLDSINRQPRTADVMAQKNTVCVCVRHMRVCVGMRGLQVGSVNAPVRLPGLNIDGLGGSLHPRADYPAARP